MQVPTEKIQRGLQTFTSCLLKKLSLTAFTLALLNNSGIEACCIGGKTYAAATHAVTTPLCVTFDCHVLQLRIYSHQFSKPKAPKVVKNPLM